MLIDIIPAWSLFFVSIVVVYLSIEMGFRIGRSVGRGAEDEGEAPASSIAGTILGLQAFMLAFTFSIASDRYDTKKALVREEAGVLRTAFHRSDLLQEPARFAIESTAAAIRGPPSRGGRPKGYYVNGQFAF